MLPVQDKRGRALIALLIAGLAVALIPFRTVVYAQDIAPLPPFPPMVTPQPDNQIVIERHAHWLVLVPRGAVLVLAISLGAYVGLIYEFDKDSSLETPLRIVVALLVALALGWFLLRLVAWRTTNFVVTTVRCIYRSGVCLL